jgi:hypothetical protein
MHNLVDEVTWIHATDLTGTTHELTLRDVIIRAPELSMISHGTARQTISVFRLVSAIALRAGITDTWDTDVILRYLDRWRDRFDLSGDRPFGQCPSMRHTGTADTIAVANPDIATGNNRVLWSHRRAADRVTVTVDKAAVMLVTDHQTGLGGMLSFAWKGEDSKGRKSLRVGSTAPLSRALVALVIRPTLADTIATNLAGAVTGPDDVPHWENAAALEAVATSDPTATPKGTVQWWTWPSKRTILLIDPDNTVTRVMRSAGYKIDPKFDPLTVDPQIAIGHEVNRTKRTIKQSYALTRDLDIKDITRIWDNDLPPATFPVAVELYLTGHKPEHVRLATFRQLADQAKHQGAIVKYLDVYPPETEREISVEDREIPAVPAQQAPPQATQPTLFGM